MRWEIVAGVAAVVIALSWVFDATPQQPRKTINEPATEDVQTATELMSALKRGDQEKIAELLSDEATLNRMPETRKVMEQFEKTLAEERAKETLAERYARMQREHDEDLERKAIKKKRRQQKKAKKA